MEALVTLIAKQLVDHPDDVSVTESASREDHYELSVRSGDLGQVIGRQGRTARAIRSVARAAGAKQGRRVQVEIVE